MAYRVELKPSAAAQLRKLDRGVQQRILAKLAELAENPRPHGVRKLAGADDLYRVRVGAYRVIYTISDDELLVLILVIADRKDAYR